MKIGIDENKTGKCSNLNCEHCNGTGEIKVVSETERKIYYCECYGNDTMSSLPHREESMDAKQES